MNGKRLIVIVSLLIIIVGGAVLLLRFKQDNSEELAKETNTESHEVTEEDYKVNPKYILEELIVSNGKHFQYPQVKNVWDYRYVENKCFVYGALELDDEQYDGVIKQLDDNLDIPRYEEGPYKDRPTICDNYMILVDDREDTELVGRKKISVFEAEVKYFIKVADCKYQTDYKGQGVMCILMAKKYDKNYMLFFNNPEFKCFAPVRGE